MSLQKIAFDWSDTPGSVRFAAGLGASVRAPECGRRGTVRLCKSIYKYLIIKGYRYQGVAPAVPGLQFRYRPPASRHLLATWPTSCLKQNPSPTDFAKGEGFAFDPSSPRCPPQEPISEMTKVDLSAIRRIHILTDTILVSIGWTGAYWLRFALNDTLGARSIPSTATSVRFR
jgi:hypothetical protein